MAAPREQSARILRTDPDTVDDVHEPTVAHGDPPLAHVVGDAVVRRPAETPVVPAGEKPGTEKPPVALAAVNSTPPKSAKRKLVAIGIGALLAIAAVTYGVNYTLVGRFYVSTDDAYVRANNTMLGARVSGRVATILAADNALVRTGEVIFRVDDGDYRIAVDAARSKIATQQASIDRIGRQASALESAIAQANAQLASAQVASKRPDLAFDRQRALSVKGFASHATFEVLVAGRDPGG